MIDNIAIVQETPFSFIVSGWKARNSPELVAFGRPGGFCGENAIISSCV
jgi:hypothetical protein